MDINSLLSPQDSPARETPPPAPPDMRSPSLPPLQSPSKRAIRQMPSRTPSGLREQITSSPQPHAVFQQQVPSPGITSYANGTRVHSAMGTPPVDPGPVGSPHDPRMTPPNPLHRQTSTPGMDTLADLASMQQQQQAARQSYSAARPSISLQNIPRTLSGGSATDISMAESSPKPRTFATQALDQDHINYLLDLDKALLENPFHYYSHLSLVSILHQGLQNHLAMIDPANGHSYELLPILKDAYTMMANKYPLGEQVWGYRLEDAKALARDLEGRMEVLELYKQATKDEPYSAKLWVSYGDYFSHLVSCSWDQNTPEQWSEEEKNFGKELFTPQTLFEIWQQGADNVKYNLQDSSLVWDRYLQYLEEELEKSNFDQNKILRYGNILKERLSQPHASWGDTLARFSSFNTKYYQHNYEAAMEQIVQESNHIKMQYANREEYEFLLLQAVQQGDQNAAYHAMTRYLKWEKKTMGIYSFHLVNALFERATLMFPVDASLWEDHIEFLIWQKDPSVDLLNVLERATRHCPWSGSLWSHRILTLEAENREFNEIELVKHTATGTGLLEYSDLEELIKVQIAWCGYLRRKAFEDPNATEDDADIAEVGIRSALELVKETGMNKYGRDWSGDSSYRLERIHIKFWLQRGNEEEARQIWDSLVRRQQDSYDFWYRYYIWEMVVWSNHAIRDKRDSNHQLRTPSRATRVLERGMERLHTLDQPEPLIEMYVNHCEQHESVLEVRKAAIEQRRAQRIVSIRREREKASLTSQDQVEGTGKRKREDLLNEDHASKKSKQVDAEQSTVKSAIDGPARNASEIPSETYSITQKRDREHSSITVRNLPSDTNTTRIRQFFTDAGNVRNVTTKLELDSLTAIVEFDAPEEADYALTKEAKGFEGRTISITREENTTLYVTNYPPHADEPYIRKLFEPFGEIVGIRFPSLKFDTHRRFCYVQFAAGVDAAKAIKLDGSDVEGLTLDVKISNPNAKKQRGGATAEGREVYVWHLNFKIPVRDIEGAFTRFGKIERINLPKLKNGNNKGFCFIVYEKKASAEEAVAEMNQKEFWGLDLHVEIAVDRSAKKPKIVSTVENAASPQDRGPTPGHAEEATNVPSSTRSRSIAFLNLPDTVNDARIAALVEPYEYKKITLMPQHGGAIVEFTSVEGSGKAEIALAGHEFDGRKLEIGSVQELKKQKGEFKAKNNFIQPNRVNRPTARGGARGRGRLGIGRPSAVPRAVASSSNGDVKSNEDFRAMLLSGKQQAVEETKDKPGE